MNERAVSEIIGFIIIFGMVVTSIGIVYANAVPQLQESREVENVQNAERAFSILQNNINDVSVRQAPSRSTQIRLQGSTIEILDGSETSINVTVNGFSRQYAYSPIVYTNTDDLRIVYENGAVFRSIRDGGSGMTYKPNWRINEDVAILPIIRTIGGTASVSGTSTVLIRACASNCDSRQRNVGTNVTEDPGNVDLNVTVESPRADGWEIYMSGFESDGLADDVGRSGDTVYMEVENLDKVVRTEEAIDLAIER